MTLEQLNQELSKMCAIPEEDRTRDQKYFIYELEQLIDARTVESNHE